MSEQKPDASHADWHPSEEAAEVKPKNLLLEFADKIRAAADPNNQEQVELAETAEKNIRQWMEGYAKHPPTETTISVGLHLLTGKMKENNTIIRPDAEFLERVLLELGIIRPGQNLETLQNTLRHGITTLGGNSVIFKFPGQAEPDIEKGLYDDNAKSFKSLPSSNPNFKDFLFNVDPKGKSGFYLECRMNTKTLETLTKAA